MTIEKTFEGGLVGTSYGEMLSSMGAPDGNAGYVAIERFEGQLDGKKGSFSLMHYGRMMDGEDSLVLEVVPGSGADDLAGVQGSMEIHMAPETAEHSYVFSYQLP
jgi:hypothetical protein